MFIELTDHLRCVAGHEEGFLVLVPGTMAGRRVIDGTLGCPVCQAEYPIVAGVAHLGREPATVAQAQRTLPDAAALRAFLGLEGPGGYLALFGGAGSRAEALGAVLPGVHLVAINPPGELTLGPQVSVVRAARVPLKLRSMRGVVLGEAGADLMDWQRDAIRAVLPGLRATGAGPEPVVDDFELLGAADGWWVGVRR